MRLVDKSSRQGLKAKSRGEGKQSKFYWRGSKKIFRGKKPRLGNFFWPPISKSYLPPWLDEMFQLNVL